VAVKGSRFKAAELQVQGSRAASSRQQDCGFKVQGSRVFPCLGPEGLLFEL